jgi:predicted MFS family arabinose efflux permease
MKTKFLIITSILLVACLLSIAYLPSEYLIVIMTVLVISMGIIVSRVVYSIELPTHPEDSEYTRDNVSGV